MSSLDRRLATASYGLSARERVILILRADAEGRDEDPAWWDAPDFRVAECNRLVGLANGVNHILVPHAMVLHSEVETLEVRFRLLAALIGWDAERALRLGLDAEEAAADGTPPAPWSVFPAMWQDAPVSPDSALTVPGRRLRSLAERVARGIEGCWARLLAVELVVGETVEQLADEVLIPQPLRDLLALTRAMLERLYLDAPQFVGELERPEADPAILEMLDEGMGVLRGG